MHSSTYNHTTSSCHESVNTRGVQTVTMKQEKQEKKGEAGGSVSSGGSTPKADTKSPGYVMEHKGIPKLYIYKVAL